MNKTTYYYIGFVTGIYTVYLIFELRTTDLYIFKPIPYQNLIEFIFIYLSSIISLTIVKLIEINRN